MQKQTSLLESLANTTHSSLGLIRDNTCFPCRAPGQNTHPPCSLTLPFLQLLLDVVHVFSPGPVLEAFLLEVNTVWLAHGSLLPALSSGHTTLCQAWNSQQPSKALNEGCDPIVVFSPGRVFDPENSETTSYFHPTSLSQAADPHFSTEDRPSDWREKDAKDHCWTGASEPLWWWCPRLDWTCSLSRHPWFRNRSGAGPTEGLVQLSKAFHGVHSVSSKETQYIIILHFIALPTVPATTVRQYQWSRDCARIVY